MNRKDFDNLEIWQQLYYEQVFEALGYSRNKEIMLKLSKSGDIKFIKTIDTLTKEKIESVLFHVSGLFPDVTDIQNEETSEYMRKSIDIWSTINE